MTKYDIIAATGCPTGIKQKDYRSFSFKMN